MAVVDPNLEWLGYVQPVGLVLSPIDPRPLRTRARGADARGRRCRRRLSRAGGRGPGARRSVALLLAHPWAGASIRWPACQAVGRLPDGLSVAIDEADTVLEPHWVGDRSGGPADVARPHRGAGRRAGSARRARRLGGDASSAVRAAAARERSRCARFILPIDAFYEWRANKGGKQPYAIAMKDRSPFGIAGWPPRTYEPRCEGSDYRARRPLSPS